MEKEFDVIVIGTGPAGSAIAESSSEKGRHTAIIDSRGYGGTCPLRGCNPKKVLASATNLIAKNKRMQGKGLRENSTIDWKDLIAFKRTFTEPIPEAKEEGLQNAGVTTFHGKARFIGENKIQISDQILIGDKIVIATGANPTAMPIKGEEHLTYSHDFLELDHLPEKLIFVGGGYVSFELAHVAARAGSEVHIVQRGEQALKEFNPDLVDQLIKQSEAIGIQVHLNTAVHAVEKTDNGFTVKAKKDGEMVKLDGDLIVHGAGRVPEIEDLQPDKASVQYDKSGITVNEFLQSVSNSDIYAAGDVAATNGPPLTPVAGLEAEVVTENLLKGNREQADYIGVPSVVFTTPKLAMAGMSEQQAKESGKNIEVHDIDVSGFFTYKHTNEPAAAVKIIIDQDGDQIIGAHLMSDEADELINYFAMAIQLKLKTADLKKVTYAFPTAVSDIPSML